jgi:hypothetical protein
MKKLGVTKKQKFLLNKGGLLFAFRYKKPSKEHKGGDWVGIANPLIMTPFQMLGIVKRPKNTFKMNVKQALGVQKRPKGSFKMKSFWTGK